MKEKPVTNQGMLSDGVSHRLFICCAELYAIHLGKVRRFLAHVLKILSNTKFVAIFYLLIKFHNFIKVVNINKLRLDEI